MNQSESIPLIELCKNDLLLYNSKDKNYRKKSKREDVWKEISKTMQITMQRL